MASDEKIIAEIVCINKHTKSRWPARLDLLQSASGLILVIFMCLHMIFVASILLGKDYFWSIARAFEGFFLFGKSYPWLVSIIVAGVITLLVFHVLLAIRKFPNSYQQYRAYRQHMGLMRHGDTSLWMWQIYTGFAMLFLTMPHLYIMLTHPSLIGPFASADRVWSDLLWPLYIALLCSVELHGGIGLYRLFIKWGWFMGKNPNAARARLQRIKWGMSGFFLVLGFASLIAYMKIGIEHQTHYGERYTPAQYQQIMDKK